ncbi:MAG: FtsQ-type POTRA domain-containing protein [Chitinivibrionales bacterium]|nr:FtsQ-type POTRA domain-containing protein [Chitinivibrionales bacterium]
MPKKKRVGANQKKKMSENRRGPRKGRKLSIPSWIWFVFAGIGVAGALGFGWIRYGSGIAERVRKIEAFTLREIEVGETRIVDKEMVVALSGLGEGMHMLDVKPKKIRKKLEELEWIKKAHVYRRLPCKVKIAIVERKPVALVGLGKVYYMDRDGNLLSLLPGTFSEVPLITGLRDTIADSTKGKRLSKQSVEAITGFFKKVERRDPALLGRVSQVDFSGPSEILFTLAPDNTVITIERKGVTKKIEQLCRLLNVLKNESTGMPKHINLCRNNFAYVN